MRKSMLVVSALLILVVMALSACGGAGGAAAPDNSKGVAVVLDTGGENDRSFNEYTLKGAREAADELGIPFAYVVSEAATDYDRNIENFVSEGYGLIITVGFLMGDATTAAAAAHPDVKFAIIDSVPEGDNATGLLFAEDEVGYLAGVLAGCMTQTNVIGTVSGMEIPPVQKYVIGFQTGAKSVNPDVEALNVYIPDFNDPATGKQSGQEQIANGADVIFGVGGNTGNGGLLAANEAGLMAIGVDVDQYFTYPEVASSLITSAQKNMDVAAGDAVRAFANGTLEGGVITATVASGGVGLAPYHDWDSKIPQECKDAVSTAHDGLAAGTVDTGWSG